MLQAPKHIRRWFIAVFLLLAIITYSAVAFWMSFEHGYTVKFILPDDFQGLITLELDRDSGAEPVRLGKNVYVYTIPPTGTLRVKTFDVFESYHKSAAQYADGRVLSTDTMDETRPDEVALRSIGARVFRKAETFFGVGTLEECQKYRQAISGER